MRTLNNALLLFGLLSASVAHADKVEMRDGYPVTRKDKIFDVEDVRVGQRGIGYTVFQGAKAEPFEVEVLGIMRGMLGPGKHVILARLHGEKIEHTGVISGMSGSPVYIDGKLVGAVSYRFGSFSKEPIAGITPIASMLEMYSPTVGPAPKSPPFASAATAAGPVKLSLERSRDPAPLPVPTVTGRLSEDARGPRPIDTPIVLSGFNPDVAKSLAKRFEAAGMFSVVGGGASGIAPLPSVRKTKELDKNVLTHVAGGVGAAPIVPAAPIAVILMRGDLFVAGTGTVTYVEDGKVLGFGHPMFGFGHVVFPMATAAIINTLASEAGSYKQSAPSLEVGAIMHDRLTAIGGNFQRIAPMIPASIRVTRVDEAKTAPGVQMNVEVVDHETWGPLLMGSAIVNATSGQLGYEAGGTLDVKATFKVGDRVLEINDTYVAGPPTPVGRIVARDVSSIARIIKRNGIQWAPLNSVDVQIRANSQIKLAYLESVKPEKFAVRPGETLRATARVRPYRGNAVNIPVRIPIPADAKGTLPLLIGGAIELDRKDANVKGSRYARTLDELLAVLGERREGRGLYARTYPKAKGLRRDTELLTSLPVSQRAMLGGQAGLSHGSASQSFGPAIRIPYTNVVVGSVQIDLEVSR